MQVYKKESLELLRQRIDLVEVVSPYVELRRAGASYKACCPFHEEKTPSFVIQKGTFHYHCFGCGAHGDAIAFLMGFLKMGFMEAVESLAERFQVLLEKENSSEQKEGPNKTLLKNALDKAARFYHFSLLHSEEGRPALDYLYKRGIDLDFIRQFQIGFASKHSDLLRSFLQAQGVEDLILEQAGLLSTAQGGRKRDFFFDRVLFPICDVFGTVIGFSARKFREETFGGKYINTPETPLFKKSQVLFGLSYCRQRIAKERKALIVEGQIDALRLIYSGFNFSVAGQGTAFGEGHVRELLHIGVNHAYLALDGDEAGLEAAVKVGNLFQKKGVEVSIVELPVGQDPDSLLREQGPEAFQKLLEESGDYLNFLFKHLSKGFHPLSPSKKNELVHFIAGKIRDWEHPIMVHESLRKLAQLAQVPESLVEIEEGRIDKPFKKTEGEVIGEVDPDRILENDLLRWLLLKGEVSPNLVEIAKVNLKEHQFRVSSCRRLFSLYLSAYQEGKPRDLFSLGISLENNEEQKCLFEIMQKRVNLQKAEEGLVETIRKILIRQWMEEREAIKAKIHSGSCSEEEAIVLAKQFDELKRKLPEVVLSCPPNT